MDFLRSCYKSTIAYSSTDSSLTAPAQWYFAKPSAECFPAPHAFASSIWDTVHPTPTTLGWDATKSRTWTNGRNLNHSDGTNFAGKLAEFQTGQGSEPPLVRGINNTPADCIARPAGKCIGGQAVANQLVCPSCLTPNCLPMVLKMVVKSTPSNPCFTQTMNAIWSPTFGPDNGLVNLLGAWGIRFTVGANVMRIGFGLSLIHI